MRLSLVISEHAGGLIPERMEQYERAERRLGTLARAGIETVHYTEFDGVGADAVILSGSFDPWAMHEPEALGRLRDVVRTYDGPVLGICAGMQLQVEFAGGSVVAAERGTEIGFGTVDVVDDSDLFRGLGPRIDVFEHHTDEVASLPEGFRVLASSATCAVEAIAARDRPWWGTQFHPERWSSEHPAGETILRNFLALAGIPLL